MARPQKQTVDYFPHYAKASDGKTLYILQSRFGNDGYAFWFKLLELIASNEGHFYNYTNPCEWQFLLAKTMVSAEVADQILKTLADVGAIDSELYERHIIWVQKFVDNLSDLYKRRKVDSPRKPMVFANSNPVNADNNGVSTSNNPQSKVKYSKVKYINNTPSKNQHGEFQNVLLTHDEYQKLEERFNQETNKLIENLSSYLASTGKRYKSHYATILNWKRRDKDEKGKGHSRELPTSYTPTRDDYPDV